MRSRSLGALGISLCRFLLLLNKRILPPAVGVSDEGARVFFSFRHPIIVIITASCSEQSIVSSFLSLVTTRLSAKGRNSSGLFISYTINASRE
jgi:hypothetical protein